MKEIIEQIKKEWVKLFVCIPIALIVFGTAIENIFLSSFGLSNFSPIKAQSITVGLIFVVVCCILYAFSFTNIDKKSIAGKSILKLIIQQCLKLISFTLVFFFIFVLIKVDIDIYYKTTLEKTLFFIALFVSIEFSQWLILHWLIKEVKGRDNDRFWKFMKRLDIVVFWMLLVAGSICGIYYFINEDSFRKLVISFSSIFILPIAIYSGERIAQEKVEEEANDEKEQLLKNKAIGLLKETAEGILFLIIALSMFLILYSRNVYKYLPQNCGGGMSNELIITFKDDTEFPGRIILSNSDFVYIVDENNEVYIFGWDDIYRVAQV